MFNWNKYLIQNYKINNFLLVKSIIDYVSIYIQLICLIFVINYKYLSWIFMDHISFVFNIDRGGTFTDFYVEQYQNSNQKIANHVFKHISEQNSKEGPIQGIKQFLQNRLQTKFQKIPTKVIKRINMGTTLITNALLQKKGLPNAILLTKGFEDLLFIRNQTRPNIFDLKCQKPQPLYIKSYGIDERVFLNKYDEVETTQIEIEQNNSKKLLYVKKPNVADLQQICQDLKKNNINSLAIALANSYLYDENQKMIQNYFLSKGFTHVYISSQRKTFGYLKRAQTVSLQAFLNPFIQNYFQNFRAQFDQPNNLILRLMKSDGGFTNQNLRATQALLSGPAGGLIGYSSLIKQINSYFNPKNNIKSVIGLDMGGTSTDVSRYDGEKFNHIYNFEINGIELNTPHLQISTIAAGGGSKLKFLNGMFKVGPESVGANPGPICYGKGNQLALTDANLILNRLDPDLFPKKFGLSGNQAISKVKSLAGFQILKNQINQKIQIPLSIEQIALGFIQIGNQMMANSVRKLYSAGLPDALIVFGSAGGQHACAIAEKIGINVIYIDKYSGILSAYGLSKSSIVKQQNKYLGKSLKQIEPKILLSQLSQTFNELYSIINEKRGEMEQQQSKIEKQLAIKYEGTDYSIIVNMDQNFIASFYSKHLAEFGFCLENKTLTLQFIRIRVTYSLPEELLSYNIPEIQNPKIFQNKRDLVYFQGGFQMISFYSIDKMNNSYIEGPAVLISATSSILVEPNWNARVINQNVLLIRQEKQLSQKKNQQQQKCDPIKLSLYSSRFFSIAQQMGKSLQRTSISTNIKQRLDFSCAIFDKDGNLIVNAPHLPVHLGSMQTTVIQQIKHGFNADEIILTNHPKWGGSHLPDLTIITQINIQGSTFYLGSRGHHADIGASTPGSMPAFSKELKQQGVAIGRFVIVKNGEFKQKQLKQLFKNSRQLEDNISDLKAQISANATGVTLLKKLIADKGKKEVISYINYIRQNAQQQVRNMLKNFAHEKKFPPIYTLHEQEYMDDGTKLNLNLTIDSNKGSAKFDFTGTETQVYGNTNAPEAITKSAILYSLRCLVKSEIPLNSGCLIPIQIIIPLNSILSPSEQAAVVGGNVQTSQRLVDLILKPFGEVAASQGTMNNFLFGNNKLSYYQTIAGGTGAGKGFNGTTSQSHMTNTRITDLQTIQKKFPVALLQFKKRHGSGGQGMWNGGQGMIRQMVFFDDITISILSQRRVSDPYGLQGGENGKRGRNLLIRKGLELNLGSKNEVHMKKNDRIRIQTPGGGSYGKKSVI